MEVIMDYKTHAIAGACTGICAACILSKTQSDYIALGMMALTSTLGALLPDADEPESYIGRRIKIISICLKKLFGHRGALHSPFVAIILSICLLLPKSYFTNVTFSNIYMASCIGFSIGYWSHLLIDSLTKGGIPVFWPIFKTKFNIMNLYTNNKIHQIVVKIVCIGITVIFIGYRLSN